MTGTQGARSAPHAPGPNTLQNDQLKVRAESSGSGDKIGPRRPLDVWRVCGQDVTTGCTCPSGGPSHTAAAKAVVRLAGAT